MSWRYRVSFVKVKVLCLGFQKRTTKSVVKLYLQHYCRSMQILECEPGRIAYNTGLHKGCFYKGAIPTLQGQSDASDSVGFYY